MASTSRTDDPGARITAKRCETLGDLAERLRTTDLVPSQQPLLDRTEARLESLADAGISSVADLRAVLKDRRSAVALAAETGVDEEYLVLLGRAVRGFFPKPTRLRTFEWLDPDVVVALAEAGVRNSDQLLASYTEAPSALAARSAVPETQLSELAKIADLLRVQWISPNYARALVAAGFDSPEAVGRAAADDLARAVADANRGNRYYDATIGLRDTRRIIDAARYVPTASANSS